MRARGVCHIRWWHAGGLHIHVTYPDGSWERRVLRRDQWFEVDVIRFAAESEYGRNNVQVTP